ncbi:unnamed protein product [Pedinophyceae sp. YPF-701]|nr:unnamed protein product [Pedinophyceae sp. YPF-701]
MSLLASVPVRQCTATVRAASRGGAARLPAFFVPPRVVLRRHTPAHSPLAALRGPERKVAARALSYMSDVDSLKLDTLCSRIPSPLVSVQWLKDHLTTPGVVVLEANWHLPTTGKGAADDFMGDRIPGAQFFDVDLVADTSSGLPHMLPAPEVFGRAMDALGVTRDTLVVVYDRSGIFSAPRLWWMLRAFGHERVKVLEGGFPAWAAAKGAVDAEPLSREGALGALAAAVEADADAPLPRYAATLDMARLRTIDDVLRIIEDKSETIVDARSASRFQGSSPEPRPGLRSGHMPGARNVPFDSCLSYGGAIRNSDELVRLFASEHVDIKKPVTVTCGSGMTACVVALALETLGAPQVAVYDGSWAEYGGRADVPVSPVKGASA